MLDSRTPYSIARNIGKETEIAKEIIELMHKKSLTYEEVLTVLQIAKTEAENKISTCLI